jgi:hypothetical protein
MPLWAALLGMIASLAATVLSALRTTEALRKRSVRLLWPFPGQVSSDERPGYFAGKIGMGFYRTIFFGALTVAFGAFSLEALHLVP